jgi:hypothetical protein
MKPSPPEEEQTLVAEGEAAEEVDKGHKTRHSGG